MELFQLQNDQGPCLECYRSGQPVSEADLAAAGQRWPLFAPAAAGAGFGAVQALPMRVRDEVIGAMNMFMHAPGRLDETRLQVGQALADVATIGLLHERNLRYQEVLAAPLQGALNSRIAIEQAKGVVAGRLGLDMGQAFSLLRDQARAQNRRLAELATAVACGAEDMVELGVPAPLPLTHRPDLPSGHRGDPGGIRGTGAHAHADHRPVGTGAGLHQVTELVVDEPKPVAVACVRGRAAAVAGERLGDVAGVLDLADKLVLRGPDGQDTALASVCRIVFPRQARPPRGPGPQARSAGRPVEAACRGGECPWRSRSRPGRPGSQPRQAVRARGRSHSSGTRPAPYAGLGPARPSRMSTGWVLPADMTMPGSSRALS